MELNLEEFVVQKMNKVIEIKRTEILRRRRRGKKEKQRSKTIVSSSPRFCDIQHQPDFIDTGCVEGGMVGGVLRRRVEGD